MCLLNLDDAQLQWGLGLTPQDIVVLRVGNGALANPGTDDTTNGARHTRVASRAAIEQQRRYLGEPTIDGFR